VATHTRQSQQQLQAFLKISASLKQLTSCSRASMAARLAGCNSQGWRCLPYQQQYCPLGA
jgi:sulfur transfer protein SufE